MFDLKFLLYDLLLCDENHFQVTDLFFQEVNVLKEGDPICSDKFVTVVQDQ